MKLKYRQVSEYRHQQLIEQKGFCALCGDTVNPEEAVLDHCHQSGFCRGVLHRGCNALLGKIERNLKINRITDSRLVQILAKIPEYREHHLDHQYPTWREKKVSTRKKHASQ